MPKIIEYPDELTHYGRLGMKWGQHIFGKEPSSRARKKRKYLSETSPDKKGEHAVESNSSKVALSKVVLRTSASQAKLWFDQQKVV